MHVFSVSNDFSRYPAGRYLTDGPFPGEKLRAMLEPLLRQGEVKILLDGPIGYGSGFLEETFGGLVRVCAFTVEDLRKNLVLEAEDDSLVSEIWDYIADAGKRASRLVTPDVKKDSP